MRLLIPAALLFACGLIVGRRTGAPAHAAVRPDTEVLPGATACVDTLAMDANRNLAAQVKEYQSRYRAARDAQPKATFSSGTATGSAPVTLDGELEKAKWKDRAETGAVSVRLPCSSWRGYGSEASRSANHGRMSGRGGSRRSDHLLESAGLQAEDASELDEVYARTNAKIWAKIASICEGDSGYRASLESEEAEETPSIAEKIEKCQSNALTLGGTDLHEAAKRIANKKALGVAINPSGKEETILAAVMSGETLLKEDLVHTFGATATMKLLDQELLCMNKTDLDTRPNGNEDIDDIRGGPEGINTIDEITVSD